MPKVLTLYHGPASPNSRRVRMFVAEKGISVPLVSIDLAAGKQHGETYRAIKPRRVVPTLVLEDGTAGGRQGPGNRQLAAVAENSSAT